MALVRANPGENQPGSSRVAAASHAPADWLERSWARCKANGKRRPDAVSFDPVPASRAREVIERSRAYVDIARPALDLLARAVAPAEHVVFTTDHSGAIISALGEFDRYGPVVRAGARIGVDLSETAIGTTSIGGALHERRTVEIHGSQHFFEQLSICNCAAAPVFDPRGELIAVVDVTSDTAQSRAQLGRMVEATAREIQNRLIAVQPVALQLRLNWHPMHLGGPNDALIGFDADGVLVSANQAAHELCSQRLHCDGSLSTERAIGQRASWLFDAFSKPGRQIALRLPSGLGVVAVAETFGARNGRPVAVARSVPHAAPVQEPDNQHGMVFGDSQLAKSFVIAQRAFGRRLPILLSGETGTGKEVAACALHQNSTRGNGPFIALNCASIPSGLIESELFGYADGAFTGARRGGTRGKLEAADGGSLFLDEIGDMPIELQARLLRVLEQRQVVRLGETASRPTDFALICASHRDLRQLVTDGRFREDLYFRIRGFTLTLPALRDRDQIDSLIDIILESEATDAGEPVPSLSNSARTMLRHYRWPGNIRELRYAIRYAMALSDGRAQLTAEELPADVRASSNPLGSHHSDMQQSPIDALTDRLIRETIEQCGGNISAAARRLGIGRATIYRRLREREA